MNEFFYVVRLHRKVQDTPILKFLSELHMQKTRAYDTGICYNLRRIYGATKADMDQFANLCTRWPNYSGRIDYPIPSPCGVKEPSNYYLMSINLWTGNQLKQRLSLIDFVIHHWKD